MNLVNDKTDIFRANKCHATQLTGIVTDFFYSIANMPRLYTEISGFLLFILILLLPMSASANSDPDAVIRRTIETILPLLERNINEYEKDRTKLYSMVSQNIVPIFSMQAMSKEVLGREIWVNSSQQQRDDFIEQFTEFLVRTYAISLLVYTNQKVIYHSSKYNQDNRFVSVITEIKQGPGRDPVNVEYKLYNSKDGWKIYDFDIDGSSVVEVYKGQFRNIARDKGMDQLISKIYMSNVLSRKN